MNIGLYGHSMAQWTRKQPFSFGTKLVDHFNADIVNSGCAQGSEERILFELKKTKKLDLAIIFHSNPDFFFVPGHDRDYTTLDRDTLLEKVPSGKVKDWFKINGYINVPDEYCNWWESIPNMTSFELLKQFNIAPDIELDNIAERDNFTSSQAFREWCNANTSMLRDLVKQKVPLHEEVEFWLGLFDALELHKKYLYHHDLQMNRYYGALTQIDQYLKFKKIPVLHCLGPEFWYPNWFTFESGVIDSEIYKLQHEISGHYAQFADSENNMTETGNQIAFDLMIPLIHQALEKVK